MKRQITVPILIAAVLIASEGQAQQRATNIFQATVGDTNARTGEISTEELREALTNGDILLIDARPRAEWAIGHIPGAVNVAPTAGKTLSQYTASAEEIGRLLQGKKNRAVVLYCNGAYCGKSRRIAEELSSAGFSNVRRYQLGAPVWRALGGVMVIELEALNHVYSKDRTAVWIDARDAESFSASTIEGARNLPHARLLLKDNAAREVTAAKDDGRLPMLDHNTRIIVFGTGATQARAVAEAIARNAFHNVAYFEGTYEALRNVLGP